MIDQAMALPTVSNHIITKHSKFRYHSINDILFTMLYKQQMLLNNIYYIRQENTTFKYCQEFWSFRIVL